MPKTLDDKRMSVPKLDGSTQTIIPAYGRKYRTRTQIEEAFKSGKDFILADITSRWHGKYCSIRDFETGVKVRARFGLSLEHVTFLYT